MQRQADAIEVEVRFNSILTLSAEDGLVYLGPRIQKDHVMKRGIQSLALLALAVFACSGCHGLGNQNGCNNCNSCNGPIGCRPCRVAWQRGGTDYGAHLSHNQYLHDPQAGSGVPAPTTAYPYYTTRGPRDFLANNPPSIGR